MIKANKYYLTKIVLLICIISFNTNIFAVTTRFVSTEAEFNAAYTNSASGDFISLNNNLVITSEKIIAKTITLDGNGYTMSVLKPGVDDNGVPVTGSSAYRVFTISTSSTVTINNLTIKGGGSLPNGLDGGAIYLSSACVLKLNSCVVSNSRTVYNGGGAIANYGVIYLYKTKICRNVSYTGGGIVNFSGGTIYIENSSITENCATYVSGGGGGIDNAGNLYINNSSISNNKNAYIGGGISNASPGYIYLINSSVTGNVSYGNTSNKGGGIGSSGGYVYAINTLFAYNYHVSTMSYVLYPTAYELDDIVATSAANQAKINLYYCVYHATLPVGTNNTIGNVQYTGTKDGSNNSIFSGGLLAKITNSTGADVGTASAYRPYLYSTSGLVAPTLKSSNFLLNNKGTQTRFANKNNVSPVVAYYNKSTGLWVDLTGVSNATQLISIDQASSARSNPPVVGAIEDATDNLFMVKVQNNVSGTVSGGSTFGDVYQSGTSASLTAIPNSGSGFNRWDYFLGGTGTASTANPYTFTVTKNTTLVPFYNTLLVSTTTDSRPSSEGTSDVTITATVPWTATSDKSWLTLVTTSGTGNATLSYNYTANPAITPRTATIKISSPGFSDILVTFTQDAAEPNIEVSAWTSDLGKNLNSTSSINVTSNTSWSSTIWTSNVNWLRLSPGLTGDGVLTFTATETNPTISPRSALVIVSATGAFNTPYVTVTQAAGDTILLVSSNTATVAKTANSSTTVNVISNTSWTATSNQTWLTITKSGTANATLTATATTTNQTINTRTAIITLKAIGAVDKTITVTQEVGDATLIISATTANVTKIANGSAIIDVTSNSTWTASSNQSWLSVTSGAIGNSTLTLTTLTNNPLITTRTATVTVKVTGITDKTITVTQAVGDPTLTVSATTANVSKTASSNSFVTLTSNTTWTAISDQSWLSVVSGGTGNTSLTFTANTTNPFITTRIATVTLKATGTVDQIVTITQAVGDATLSVSATTANVAKTANSTSKINIISNSTWLASSDQSWLLVKSNGNGDYSIPFSTVSANPLATTRQAIITIKALGVADKIITVTQAGFDPTLEVAAITASVEKMLNATAIVNVTSNTTWTTSSNQSWLSVTSGTTGSANVTFTATEANPTITSRNAIVTLKATGAADKSVTVTQAAGDATLSVSANTASLLKTANSSASINVTSNATWKATSDQTWLTVTSSATGNNTLTLTANTTNPTINGRIATVTLKTTGAADKTVTITQAAGDATLSVSATTASVSETAFSTSFVTITSNTLWTATSNQSWLSVTPSGSGNASLTFSAATGNSLITTRTATVTVKATGVTDKTITVTQLASTPFLTVSKNSVVLDPKANNTTSVTITSNTVWSASSDQSWLTVSSGANGILNFSAANTTVTRQAIVTLSASGVSDNKITVIQSLTSDNIYQLNMTVTSIATLDNLEIANGDIQLSAFIGIESRGTTTLKYVESTKRYMGFLMVWGNAEDVNKTITFKSYDPISTNELTAINNSVKFMPESITGSPSNPYSIDFTKKVTTVDNFKGGKVVNIYPNPVDNEFRIIGLSGVSSISLTDLSGRVMLLKQVSDSEAVSISTLPKGVYILKVKNNDATTEQKVVKK